LIWPATRGISIFDAGGLSESHVGAADVGLDHEGTVDGSAASHLAHSGKVGG
jgi:hypothetical protein